MYPYGSVDKGKPVSQLHGGAGGLQVAAGIYNERHILLGHTGQQLQTVGVEGPGIIVGVGIKYTHNSSSISF